MSSKHKNDLTRPNRPKPDSEPAAIDIEDDWDNEPDTDAHKFAENEIDALIDSCGDRTPILLALAGVHIGKSILLERERTVIGRGKNCDIHIADSSVSRKHAEIIAYLDGRYEVRDLGSTNGTYIGKRRVRSHMIKEGDRIVFGLRAVYKMSFQDALEQSYQHVMYSSSVRDALTSVYNRKYLEEKLKADFAYCRRHGSPLSLLMLDVDHFKKVNDTYSHQTGDMVLKAFTAAVQKLVHKDDTLGRYGGEEFAVISPGIDYEGATMLAERIRRSIEELSLTSVEEEAIRFKITVSIGLLTVASPSVSSPDDMFAAADANLYKAKDEGRNRVVASMQYM